MSDKGIATLFKVLTNPLTPFCLYVFGNEGFGNAQKLLLEELQEKDVYLNIFVDCWKDESEFHQAHKESEEVERSG